MVNPARSSGRQKSGVNVRRIQTLKWQLGILDCAGRAERRRRFRSGEAASNGQPRSVVRTSEKRRQCEAYPNFKMATRHFGLRRQSGAATALSKRKGGLEWSTPLGRQDVRKAASM